MHEDASNSLFYKRSLFTTRLPRDRFYTQLHYWLSESNGTWRIGLTRFATRLIGEIVDYGFDIEAGAPVRSGQLLGWIEGFKAVSDIRSALDGSFRGSNSQLSQSPEVIDRDCYGAGWLYEVEGRAECSCLDAQSYAAFLDATIDELLEKQPPAE